MKYELEVIVQEERCVHMLAVNIVKINVSFNRFTEKEMSNIEYALENCKTLAQTMQTLLQ